MFRPKKKEVLVEEEVEEETEGELEEEIEDEDEVEEETKETPNIKKKLKIKSSYSVGDIIPIQQTVGYQVVKEINEDNRPIVTTAEKLSEAEILSFIYQH